MSAVQDTPEVEIWKSIPFSDGYDVSNHGRVRSWWAWRESTRNVGEARQRMISPRIVDGWEARHGYRMVVLEKKKWFIHHLVLLVFVGDPPDGKRITRHLDGNPSNNRLDNICWGNQTENYADARRHGTNPKGTRHGMNKLTDEQVLEIVAMRKEGVSIKEIGRRFGVTSSLPSAIARGKLWTHLTGITEPIKVKKTRLVSRKAFLTVEQVHEVFRMHQDGHRGSKIGEKMGVSKNVIWQIIHRNSYRDVPIPEWYTLVLQPKDKKEPEPSQ